MTVFALRREKLRALMKTAGLDALLVSDAASRWYLSGFELHDPQPNESAGCLVITADAEWLCTDPRYLDAARRLWDHDHIHIYTGDSAKVMGEFFSGRLSGKFGFDASTVSVAWWGTFSDTLKGVEFVRAEPLVAKLRVIKDEDEIARIRRSCALNEQMMQWLPTHLDTLLSNHTPMTETSVAWDIERYFREHGAEELAFASIVAFNENGALPHAIPSPAVSITDGGCLLVDVGCRLDGYCSDQTRVFWLGDKPHDDYLRTLDRVREAQRRAISAIRPGVTGREAYRQAWEHFVSEGCEKYFTHGLGHGVGLETHEAPSLSPRAETPLEPGMIVTVEPGLYYPEWGGVRWEYTVLVTEDGCEILK